MVGSGCTGVVWGASIGGCRLLYAAGPSIFVGVARVEEIEGVACAGSSFGALSWVVHRLRGFGGRYHQWDSEKLSYGGTMLAGSVFHGFPLGNNCAFGRSFSLVICLVEGRS